VKTAVISSESNVEIYDWARGKFVLERLLLDGCSAADSIPLLTDHQRSIASTIGSVSQIRREGDNLLGDLSFSSNTAGNESWTLVSEGHIRAVSVGYRIMESVEIAAGRSKTIGSRTFTAPADRSLRVVSRWELKEVSLVPIGADSAAQIRSYQDHFSRGRNVSTSIVQTIGQRDVRNMTLSQFFAAGLSSRGREVPENDRDILRSAVSSVEGVSDLTDLVGMSVLDGYRSVSDSLSGIYSVVSLPNFVATELARVSTPPRLERVVRNQVAPSVSFGFTSQGWRLCRFGATFIMDEQDGIDSQRIGVFQAALAEIGKAARRLIPDLLWSLLLENPTLDDGLAVFEAGTKANLGTAVLAATGLKAGHGAIGDQTATDADGAPVHVGLQGRFLIVPPKLFQTAKELMHDFTTNEGDLIVRQESRMGTKGCRDPLADVIRTGLDTNWMLAAPAEQGPSLVLGTLGGRLEPRVRSFNLDQGQYGLGFDISLDLAACCVDGRPLFWSSGTN
jgi:phage head maturation protease